MSSRVSWTVRFAIPRSTDMSSRVWASALVVCVVAGIAAVLLIALTDPAERLPPRGPSGPPRVVVRDADVPENEREPERPVRVHTIEYVHGHASSVVVKDEVYTREVDPALRASGMKELELFDSLLSPRRGVVLYQQSLTVYAGIFDPEDGRRARVCRLTWCGPTNGIQSARLVDDAQGLRAEIVRRSEGRTDVYEIVVVQDELECRKKPQDD